MGVFVASPLSSTTNVIGRPCPTANFSASWNAPMLAVMSPTKHQTHGFTIWLSSLLAAATPQAMGRIPPTMAEVKNRQPGKCSIMLLPAMISDITISRGTPWSSAW